MELRTNEDKERENLHIKCRLCLGEESLEKVISGGDLFERIAECLSIKVTGKHGFSELVCTECRIRVNEFHQFRERCREVQNVLMSFISDGHWECDKCHKVFDQKSKLTTHVRSHEPKRFKCTICGMAFVRLVLLNVHAEIHAEGYPREQNEPKKNEDTLPVVKIEPQEENITSNETQSQSEQQDANEKEIRLDESSNDKIQQNSVKSEPVDDPMEVHDHGGVLESEAESFIIDDMIDIQEVKLEMPSNDNGENSVIETPEKLGESSTASSKKRKPPTGEGPIKCDVCLKVFSQHSRLEQHKRRSHLPNMYECDICGYSFAERFAMKRHMRVHTKDGYNEEDFRLFKEILRKNAEMNMTDIEIEKSMLKFSEASKDCVKCQKRFKNQKELWHHYRCHHLPKKTKNHVQCTVCSGRFVSSKRLEVHMRMYHKREEAQLKTLANLSEPEEHLEVANRNRLTETTTVLTASSGSFQEPHELKTKCNICDKVLKRRSLWSHYRKIHAGINLDK